MKQHSPTLTIALSAIFITTTVLAYSDPTACSGTTRFYDIINLKCSTCPTNTERATDFTFCNCSTSYYHNPDIFGFNNSQSCLSASGTYTPASQVVSIYDVDGTLNPTIVNCSNSYPDSTHTKCIPCGPSMTYSPSLLSCQCSTTGQYFVAGFCYTNTNASWTPTYNPATNKDDYLAQINAVVGCGQYGVIQSCNQLLNKCVQNGYAASDFFCKLLASYQLTKSPANGLPIYSFSTQITDSISIQASSIIGTNTSSVKNTFQFILAEYNTDGSLRDLKSLDQSIFSCYLSSQDIVRFTSFGLNFYKQCSTPRTFSAKYFYDVYIVDANGKYSEVPVQISGAYYKRFLPSAYNSIELVLMSIPPLRVPYMSLSNQSPASIYTNSNAVSTSISYYPFLGVFAAFILIFLVISFFRYIRYNPDEGNDPLFCCKAVFLFFVHLFKFVAVGMWLWVFAFSMYCFCFYKFQKTVYLILPDPSSDSSGLYTQFGAYFYITFSFTIMAIIILIFNLVNNTDYFFIDWEKEKEIGKFPIGHNKKEVSVWRKVLLVNELYQLSVNRIINIEFVALFAILFLSGLKWISVNSMIPNLYDLTNSTSSTTNSILSYFIITFVIFTIAIVQFLLRHAIKTWFPLPIQDFVDLCSVSNFSIIIFDEALHGFYIHGMNSMGQSEGSLTEIESMFEKEAKSFGKSRSFKLDDPDQCQTFEVIFPFQIRRAFQVKYKTELNQTLAGRAYSTNILSNPIPDQLSDQDYKHIEQITGLMLQNFKFYLQGIKTSQFNIKERSLLEKIIDCPIDTEMMGNLPIFFKDLWNEFSNVMVSGHQFILLFNFINFVNIFFIAFKNIYFAFFVAFIFQKIFHFAISFFIKRNISRNTLIDDKFFN